MNLPPPDVSLPLAVGELARLFRRAIDGLFATPVWVQGEVTSARPAPSGHLYFVLKDESEEASVDVVFYRANLTPRVQGLLRDGARIRLRGRPSFWAPRGRLQFSADRAEPAGRGSLLEALARLKAKLEAEGLFAAERKRPLPSDPRIVGVVTSPTGAVIHDVIRVAFRRGGARILLSPAVVQGADAARSIREALVKISKVRGVDVIILGRGGGSSDDLLPFNDEELVRAVAACPVPVVSAVGHETDSTLTDFAADARAATPSHAAEMVIPDARARVQALLQLRVRLERAAKACVAKADAKVALLAGRLADPRLVVAFQQQRLDDRMARLEAATQRALTRRRGLLAHLEQRLAYLHPQASILRERAILRRLSERIEALMTSALERRRARLGALAARLDVLSPLKVLGRGYAIATRQDGIAIRARQDLSPGDVFVVRVATARIEAQVLAVEDL